MQSGNLAEISAIFFKSYKLLDTQNLIRRSQLQMIMPEWARVTPELLGAQVLPVGHLKLECFCMQVALDLCWVPQIQVQCIQEISIFLLFLLIMSHRLSKTWCIFSQEMLGSAGLWWLLIQPFLYSYSPTCAHLHAFGIHLCSSVLYSSCLSINMVEGTDR